MQERGDGTVGTELYMIYNRSLTVETYVRGVATADAAAEPHVTPYLSFGAGWLPFAGSREWTWNLTNDPSLSWAQGSLLAQPVTAPWSRAAIAGIYPHILDSRMAEIEYDKIGLTTTGRLQFIAYVMGFAQLSVLPSACVDNVTAAPVLTCKNPPQPSTIPASHPAARNDILLIAAITSPIIVVAYGVTIVLLVLRWRRRVEAMKDVSLCSNELPSTPLTSL